MSKWHNDAQGEQLAARYHEHIGQFSLLMAVGHLLLGVAGLFAWRWHSEGARQHRERLEELER